MLNIPKLLPINSLQKDNKYFTYIFLLLYLCFAIALSGVSAFLISQAALQVAAGLLHIPIAFIRLFGLLKPITKYFESLLSHDDMLYWLRDVRFWFYQNFKNFPINSLSKYGHGKMFKKITGDIKNLENFFISGVLPLIRGLISFIIINGIIFYSSVLLAIANFVIYLIIAIIIPLISNIFIKNKEKDLNQLNDEQSEFNYEINNGFNELFFRNVIKEQLFSEFDRLENRIAIKKQQINFILSIANFCSKILVLYFLIYLVFVLINLNVSGITILITSLSYLTYIDLIDGSSETFFRIFSSIESAKNIKEAILFNKPISSENQVNSFKFEKIIEFKNIEFSYPNNNNKVLYDFNLVIPALTYNVITAPSGTGKSSLLKLLLKYYNYQGDIFFDGIRLKNINTYVLYQYISYISQHTFLFSSSIRENLLLAKRKATEQEMLNILKQVGLENLLDNRNGLDTFVGDLGCKLSGGEKQRIAIARAILKDSPIILLDEPTSSLDWKNKRLFDDLIDNICSSKTIIRCEVNNENFQYNKGINLITL